MQSRDDGSYLIESNIAIGDYEKNAASNLRQSAESFPDRAFLVKCSPDEHWPELSYRETRTKADQVSSWLLNHGYGANTPILILSSNSFAHAILTLGAVQVGIPVVPVSPSYSLMSGDFAKLTYAAELVDAKMIFAEDGTLYRKAIGKIQADGIEVVTVQGDAHNGICFDDMLGDVDQALVDEAFSKVNGDTLAKILFTSGSTGMPKAVPNTHRMICSSQKMHTLVSEANDPVETPTVVLDWLPWHHTFGGNVNFFRIIRVSGTLYIDDGKPVPGLFQRTFDNIKRVRPTRFSSVPTAYSFLLDQMEKDEDLSVAFFDRVTACLYGGAALSQELFERMQVLSIKYTGLRIPFGTGWGSTETTGTGTAVYWESDKVGLIGVPPAGGQIKLVPVSDKYEIRIKGPHVHEGYFKRPDLTAEYFDDEGFYCMGDAVDFEDPSNLEQGLVFKGRVTEDFKLANGSWVSTGPLRLTLIDALNPLARDVVIAGHDKEDLAILIVPSEGMYQQAIKAGHKADNSLSVLEDAGILASFKSKLDDYNKKNKSKSRFIGSAILLGAPLSVDKNEITDKQYINQSAVLENRAQLVERLYEDGPDTAILKLR
ncbi:MAG: AMP-binding protein [Sneathiella sp.]|nr:AMP-binding protein [Sneathiella sp.]